MTQMERSALLRPLPLLFVPLVLSGCARQDSQVLGRAAFGPPTAICDLKPSPKPVTIQGTMVEKCPISGCWFKVQDRSGVLKVDTNAGGFVVADVPTGSRVTVSGTFQTDPEREISASGVRY